MKAKLHLLLLLAPIALSGVACQGGPEPEVTREVIDTSVMPAEVGEILAKATEAEQPVLINFHADW